MKLNKVLLFEEIDSTNIKSKELLETESLPFVVSANRQTSGKGRLGNKWESDSDSLYISVVIPKTYIELHYLPYLSALSIYNFLNEFNLTNVSIKWPNDILVSLKKIAGVLIEIVGNAVIIGVGVNISQNANYFQEANLNGTSIFNEIDVPFSIEEIRLKFISVFEKTFSFYIQDKQSIFHDWESKCSSIRKHIRCRVGTKIEEGIFESLGQNGELLLRTPAGLKKIYAGEILE